MCLYVGQCLRVYVDQSRFHLAIVEVNLVSASSCRWKGAASVMGGQEELMRRLLGATDVPTMLGRQWRRVNQQPLLDPHPSPSLARLEGSLVCD